MRAFHRNGELGFQGNSL